MLPRPINCTCPDTEISMTAMFAELEKHGYCKDDLRFVYNEGTNLAVFLPKATEQVMCWTQYGTEDPCHEAEQRLCLYGHRFKIQGSDRYLFLVSFALPVYPYEASALHVQMNGRDDESTLMYNRMKAAHELYSASERKYLARDPGLLFEEHSEEIGNAHTHLGIGCSISSEDRAGVVKGDLPPVLHVILDPIREEWLAHSGSNCSACRLALFGFGAPDQVGAPKIENEEDVPIKTNQGEHLEMPGFRAFLNALVATGTAVNFKVKAAGRKKKRLILKALLPKNFGFDIPK